MNTSCHTGNIVTEHLNAYFYSCYDAGDCTACSGITGNSSAEAVRDDVRGNYIDPRYITIRRVPELVGVVLDNCTVTIMRKVDAPMVGQRVIERGNPA